MSITRTLTLSGVVGLSTLVVGFVAADRLGHAPIAAPAPRAARAPTAEPETTGTLVQTVTQQTAAPDAKPTRLANGFDTERLNALMRGELPPPPAAPARKR